MQSLFALQNQMADEYEDNSQDSLEKEQQILMSSETEEDATKDTTVGKRKRRDKIVTKGALVRDGFYICNSCDKPVCRRDHRHIARSFQTQNHKNCKPVLKR